MPPSSGLIMLTSYRKDTCTRCQEGAMATISVASAKGGCGKTTVSLLVGAELALDGYKVALLDCDLNQHATAFDTKADLPGLTIASGIDEGNVLAALRKTEAESDVVLLDLP